MQGEAATIAMALVGSFPLTVLRRLRGLDWVEFNTAQQNGCGQTASLDSASLGKDSLQEIQQLHQGLTVRTLISLGQSTCRERLRLQFQRT